VKLLGRRHKQPEPVDRSAEWQEVLGLFRTRSSREMQLAIYHRQARERREAVVAVREMLRTRTPRKRFRLRTLREAFLDPDDSPDSR
jgi:hypothetical protein